MWLDKPLTAAELRRLDDFLASDEAPDTCMDISTLHGFLTAVAIGPGMVRPSEWLALVWGDDGPNFDSLQEAERIFGMIMRLYNDVVRTFGKDPEEFCPIIYEDEPGTEPRLGAELWCRGFMMGVALRPDDWAPLMNKGSGAAMMLPIFALADLKMMAKELGPAAAKEFTRERLMEMVPLAVVNIYLYWLERRKPIHPNLSQNDPDPARSPRVGRNDPCPCGSGKKYKKCCGAAEH
ncbi:MAG: UPF0149 family protein [Terriglobia bacterium]